MGAEPKLSFTYRNSSANLDSYQCSDSEWYAEVLRTDWRFVPQPDGSRTMTRRKPAEYSFTVKHRGRTRWEDVVRFTYEPSRDPKGIQIPDRTVTRLIRKHLEGTP